MWVIFRSLVAEHNIKNLREVPLHFHLDSDWSLLLYFVFSSPESDE